MSLTVLSVNMVPLLRQCASTSQCPQVAAECLFFHSSVRKEPQDSNTFFLKGLICLAKKRKTDCVLLCETCIVCTPFTRQKL